MDTPLYKLSMTEMQDYVLAVYQKLSTATQMVSLAKQILASIQIELETKISDLIVAGTLPGKNEREREAYCQTMLEQEYERLKLSKIELAVAELELAKAKIEEQALSTSVKVFSLVVATTE